MSLTISSLTRFYLFSPYKLPEREDRILALATSVILGIFTLGIAHVLCFAFLYDRNFIQKHSKSKLESATSEVFDTNVGLPSPTVEEIFSPIKRRRISPEKQTEDSKPLPKPSSNKADPHEPKFVTYHKHTTVRLSSVKEWGEQGNANYQQFLGTLYFFGYQGVKKSKSQAAYWYEKAAIKGNALALWRIGRMYMKGDGVDKSRQKGIEYVKQSAKKKFPPAVKFVEERKLNEKHVHFE